MPRRMARLLGVVLLGFTMVAAATGPAGAQSTPPATVPLPSTVVVTAPPIDVRTVCIGSSRTSSTLVTVSGLTTTGASLEVTVDNVGNIRASVGTVRTNGADAFVFPLIVAVVAQPTDPLGPFSGSIGLNLTYTGPDGVVATGTADLRVTGTIGPDCEPPTVRVPGRTVVGATEPTGSIVTFTATASDNVKLGPDPVVCAPLSGSRFAIGTTRVTCTVADAQGNQGSGSFDVVVVVAPPVISGVPANIVAEAASPGGSFVNWTNPTAVDHFGVAVPVACNPVPGVFALGATTVTCTATDTYGNTSTATFTVTVQDTTAPVLPRPADLTVAANQAGGRIVAYGVPAASDIVDGPIPASCTPPTGSLFPVGATTVTCTATDRAGNSATTAFTVTVTDAPPVLTLPGNLTAEATGPTGAPVSFAATAADLNGPVPVSCTPASGATFGLGATTVTCSASGSGGQTTGGSFTVTVGDTTAPVVTVPANVTATPTGADGASVSWPPASASDTVGGTINPTCSAASGATFAAGSTTTVTCTATDAAGNTGSASFTVTVQGFTVKGFSQPVDNSTATAVVYNTVKGGSTVPLKFEVFAGTTELTSTTVIRGLTVTTVSCATGTEDAIEELAATGGTSLRYDTTSGQFIQNWQSPRTPGACLKVTVSTTTGSTLSAWFKLK